MTADEIIKEFEEKIKENLEDIKEEYSTYGDIDYYIKMIKMYKALIRLLQDKDVAKRLEEINKELDR